MVVRKLICEICKEEFETTHHSKKYCSKKCINYLSNKIKRQQYKENPEKFKLIDKKCYRKKVGYNPNTESICEWCGKKYIKKAITNKICDNEECKRLYTLKKSNEYKKEFYKNNPILMKARHRKYYLKNRENIIEKNKEYRENNLEEVKKRKKKYYEKNKEFLLSNNKQYRIENIEQYKERDKQYYKNNKERILRRISRYYMKNRIRILEREKTYSKNNRHIRNNYAKKKLRTDVNFKLAKNLRSRVRDAFKGRVKKTKSAQQLLGCSIKQLKKYLEASFKEGMSWDNYGYYGWHIDHHLPCVSFNLEDIEEQKKCFHYTNLKPLWATDNFRKGKKVIVNEP